MPHPPRKLLVSVRRQLTGTGVELELDPSRRHPRITLTDGAGRRAVVTLACTPGDRRAERNTAARVRRILRGWGYA